MIALDDKVCIVTGALGLIGRELVRGVIDHGGRAVLADLDHGVCVDLAHPFGERAMGFGVDITEADSLEALLDAVRTRFGQVDVLVNNAAVDDKFAMSAPDESRFEHYALDRWQRMLDTNLTGTFLACQVIGSALAEQKRGSIINVASTYGIVAPDQSLYRRADGTQMFWKAAAYPVTKAGVLGLTRYLASYWGAANVRVNALSPGGVENGQHDEFVARYCARTPLGRMATANDYTGALAFLASDASAYMTGANLVVDGGFTVW
ncbi:MAG: SDR family oxidoreductase [Kofleriaceae bacterium]